jgi:hypothetical protein
MDPIGFAFEGFDHVGRRRAMEGGRPVDTTAELTGGVEPELAGVVTGPADLAARLVKSSRVGSCLVSHSFEYWLGRAPEQRDGCTLAEAKRAFDASGGNYVELVASLLSSGSFLRRKLP